MLPDHVEHPKRTTPNAGMVDKSRRGVVFATGTKACFSVVDTPFTAGGAKKA